MRLRLIQNGAEKYVIQRYDSNSSNWVDMRFAGWKQESALEMFTEEVNNLKAAAKAVEVLKVIQEVEI